MTALDEIKIIDKVEIIEVIDGVGSEVTVIEESVVTVREEELPSHVEVSVELYDDGAHRREHFSVSGEAALLQILDEGARKLNVKLLPDAHKPFDHLRGVYHDHEAGEPLNLGFTVAEFLKENPVTPHFAIELVRAIQVNTRWRVAPEGEMAPKGILALAGLSPEEYSLYFPADSKEPLPPDSPVKLHRGQRFEAQRDGKYGWGTKI